MLSITKSLVLQGLEGVLIDVEVDISSGMPSWDIVGLPDLSIRESKERVRTAIKNCGIKLPSRKYIINLSPANIRKEGSFLDLAIAIGILKSMGLIREQDLSKTVLVGEISLEGKVNPVSGILPMCIEAMKYGMNRIILPKANLKEACIIKEINVIGVENLNELICYLNGEILIENNINDELPLINEFEGKNDFLEVKGQRIVKRALEIAAAGRT